MKLKSAIAGNIALTLVALTAQSCLAQRAGDDIVYLGWAQLVPSSSLSSVTNTNAALNGFTANTTAKVDSTETTVVTWFHMFTDNIAGELTLGIPPNMTSTLQAPNAGGAGLTATPIGNAITQSVSFPSVLAKYLFNDAGSTVRPYLGLGVNYTQFDNIQPRLGVNTVSAFAGNGISLSSSWNPAFSAGLIYNINNRWSINAAVAYVPLSTTVTLRGPAGGGNTATSTLTINPTDYTVKIGYRF